MKRSKHKCLSCGGYEFVDAVDNYGQRYKGCARCRVVTVKTTSGPEKKAKP